jgi:hypothetical protein
MKLTQKYDKQLFTLYSYIQRYILKNITVNPDLFICEAEVCLYADLVDPESNITIYDTAEMANILLEIHLTDLPYNIRYNRLQLFTMAFYYFHDIADWNMIRSDTGNIPFIKHVVKRLRGII